VSAGAPSAKKKGVLAFLAGGLSEDAAVVLEDGWPPEVLLCFSKLLENAGLKCGP